MLTNIVIKVTFVDFRAQQIRAVIFQCGALYHTEFYFPWLFIHRRPRKNGFKYPALYMLLINIFILKRKHNLYLLRWARYVSICSIYFICQKVAIDFCQFFFSIIEDIVLMELLNKKWGHCARLEKRGIYLAIEFSLREISYTFCTSTRSCVRADDAKIVESP